QLRRQRQMCIRDSFPVLTFYYALRFETVRKATPAPATRIIKINGRLSVMTPVMLGSFKVLVTVVLFVVPSFSASTNKFVISFDPSTIVTV
ncbi:hypothetical protein KQJ29_27910, partial [Enterococcus sp. S181_ASV_20]|nr:hypothetical protein [Enterococcus sp. S181_ASV_20]